MWNHLGWKRPLQSSLAREDAPQVQGALCLAILHHQVPLAHAGPPPVGPPGYRAPMSSQEEKGSIRNFFITRCLLLKIQTSWAQRAS